ncbi:late embryogenesis abundant protein D-34-like [Neltuma alba]|uniref:late embryogenesis abundant protein D-34-like n=1 Tax=Neltuma alba TaxID=207710 RepID=UPI0010A336FE|nr:late embryogenesis abundant protein D-34-like [Prosopis alba]
MSHEEPRQGAQEHVVAGGEDRIQLTIGQALEATAHTVGDKPVEQSDAAAIEAAEMRATGRNEIIPGGLAAVAQKAAAYNTGCVREEDEIKMSDIVSGATIKLPADKEATRQDAVEVVAAEVGNSPNVSTTRGGVAASVAAAVRLNEKPAII